MSAYRIALDVMGGDFAPEATLLGAIEALKAWPELEITLVGPEDLLRQKCESKEWTVDLKARTTIVHAPSVVEFHDHPTIILKEKKIVRFAWRLNSFVKELAMEWSVLGIRGPRWLPVRS